MGRSDIGGLVAICGDRASIIASARLAEFVRPGVGSRRPSTLTPEVDPAKEPGQGDGGEAGGEEGTGGGFGQEGGLDPGLVEGRDRLFEADGGGDRGVVATEVVVEARGEDRAAGGDPGRLVLLVGPAMGLAGGEVAVERFAEGMAGGEPPGSRKSMVSIWFWRFRQWATRDARIAGLPENRSASRTARSSDRNSRSRFGNSLSFRQAEAEIDQPRGGSATTIRPDETPSRSRTRPVRQSSHGEPGPSTGGPPVAESAESGELLSLRKLRSNSWHRGKLPPRIPGFTDNRRRRDGSPGSWGGRLGSSPSGESKPP